MEVVVAIRTGSIKGKEDVGVEVESVEEEKFPGFVLDVIFSSTPATFFTVDLASPNNFPTPCLNVSKTEPNLFSFFSTTSLFAFGSVIFIYTIQIPITQKIEIPERIKNQRFLVCSSEERIKRSFCFKEGIILKRKTTNK